MFKENKKWIVTKAGASDEGWPWLKENDVVEVKHADVPWTTLIDKEGKVVIMANWDIDVQECKYLVPYIETDVEDVE
jgi:hypothetical protein